MGAKSIAPPQKTSNVEPAKVQQPNKILDVAGHVVGVGGVLAPLLGTGVVVKLALVGGVVILGAAAAFGIYKLYQFCKNKLSTTKQGVKNFNEEEVQKLMKQLPEWQPLNVSERDLKQVKEITLQLLKQKISHYTCPITHMVTRQPLMTSCGHFFEGVFISQALLTKGKCPVCNQAAKLQDLKKSFERQDAIQMLRLQIRKTFPNLADDLKEKWVQVLKAGMGEDFLKQDLKL